jgi:hypothetical protein
MRMPNALLPIWLGLFALANVVVVMPAFAGMTPCGGAHSMTRFAMQIPNALLPIWLGLFAVANVVAVMPAKAGIQLTKLFDWMPAFVGMTPCGEGHTQ